MVPQGKTAHHSNLWETSRSEVNGTLDYETGQMLWVEEESYDAEAFLRFLHQVVEHYPTGKIVTVLDNARIHHAKLIQPFLSALKNRLTLVF